MKSPPLPSWRRKAHQRSSGGTSSTPLRSLKASGKPGSAATTRGEAPVPPRQQQQKHKGTVEIGDGKASNIADIVKIAQIGSVAPKWLSKSGGLPGVALQNQFGVLLQIGDDDDEGRTNDGTTERRAEDRNSKAHKGKAASGKVSLTKSPGGGQSPNEEAVAQSAASKSSKAASNGCSSALSKAAKKNVARSKRRADAKTKAEPEGTGAGSSPPLELKGTDEASSLAAPVVVVDNPASEQSATPAGLAAAAENDGASTRDTDDQDSDGDDEGFTVVQSKQGPVAASLRSTESSSRWPLGVPHKDLIEQVFSQLETAKDEAADRITSAYGAVQEEHGRIPESWREATPGSSGPQPRAAERSAQRPRCVVPTPTDPSHILLDLTSIVNATSSSSHPLFPRPPRLHQVRTWVSCPRRCSTSSCLSWSPRT